MTNMDEDEVGKEGNPVAAHASASH